MLNPQIKLISTLTKSAVSFVIRPTTLARKTLLSRQNPRFYFSD